MSVESTNLSGRAWKKIPEVPAEEHPPLVARAATKTPLDPFLEGIRKSNSTEMSVLAVHVIEDEMDDSVFGCETYC